MQQVPLDFDLGPVLRWVQEQPQGRFAPQLEVVCSEHPTPERGTPGREVVVLPGCAAHTPPFLLLELLLAGAADLTLRLDECAQDSASVAKFESLTLLFSATSFTRFAVTHTPPAKNRRRPVHTASAMPVSRRKLLTLGISNANKQMGTQSGPNREVNQGMRFSPDLSLSDPERLTFALRELLGSSPAVLAAISEHTDSFAPATALTASGCTACNVCVRACPSEALRLTHLSVSDQLSVSTLTQVPASCDGCLMCVDACPSDVLRAAGNWDWATALIPTDQGANRAVPVASLTTAQCQRCRTRFPTTTGEPLCQVCSYRRKNPFASTRPPGLTLGDSAAR